jgi:hypothetical protein
MNDLFADLGPEFSPKPDRLEVVAGKVVATMNKPSAAQKRFNTLMARIDAQQELATTLRRAMDTHGMAHRQALHALEGQNQTLLKSMVLLLDARIQVPTKPKGLTANQKQQATRMVLSLCEQIAQPHDADIQAVWARYAQAEEDDADLGEQAKQETQELLESFLGEDFAQGRKFDSPEDMLRAALEFERQKRQAAEEKRAAKREARRLERKAQKGATVREQAATQKELDAQSALRTVFRQLASALHPDREPDETVRKQKTALMSEVNAAYERKDLSALLRIQLQAEMVDASKAAVLSDARLKAMCDLLTEQVRVLEQDIVQVRHSMQYEFGYPAHQGFSEKEFLAALHQEREDLQDDLAQMQADLQRVQDEKELKTWLKEQVRASKSHAAYDDGFGMNMDDVLRALMRRR